MTIILTNTSVIKNIGQDCNNAIFDNYLSKTIWTQTHLLKEHGISIKLKVLNAKPVMDNNVSDNQQIA